MSDIIPGCRERTNFRSEITEPAMFADDTSLNCNWRVFI